MDEVGVHRPHNQDELWSKELAKPALQLIWALRAVVETSAERAVVGRSGSTIRTSASDSTENFESAQERHVDFIHSVEQTLGRLLQRRP